MIKKILEDWNNRVGGNLNHKKESHLFELGSMLWEQGWSSEQIGELIKNLVEQETQFKGRTKKGDLRYFKTKDSLDKALEKGTVEPVDDKDDKKVKPEKDPTKLSGPKDFERPSDDTKKQEPKDKEEEIKTKSFDNEIDKEYYDKEPNPNDKDYEDSKPEQLELKDNSKPLKFSEDEIDFLATKFPKKYVKVLERILNSKRVGKFEPNIKSFTDAAGAGQISSTAGEIMTMMMVSMNDEQVALLEQKLGEHWNNLGDTVKNKDLILDKDWLESAKAVRAGVAERYDNFYGKGNWSIEGASWDVASDVKALGFDYSKKGFSTDAYFRLKVDGEDVLDELSLKKDLDISLSQPGVNSVFYWSLSQNKEDKERYDNIIKKKSELKSQNKTGTKEYKELTSEENKLLEKYADTIGEDGNPKIRTQREDESSMKYLQKIDKSKLELLKKATDEDFNTSIFRKTATNVYAKKLRDELVKLDPPISTEQLKEVIKKVEPGKSGRKYLNKATMITARILSQLGDEEATQHVEERIDITATFTEAYMKNIINIPEIRDGIMSTIREKFPLNALMSGEETMALGSISADRKVMKEIFGTDNYDEIEANLDIDGPDEKGFYQLLYKVKGTDRTVNLSKMRARQKGIGYESNVTFEMLIHEDFKGELYRANVGTGRDVYDPNQGKKSSLDNKYGEK